MICFTFTELRRRANGPDEIVNGLNSTRHVDGEGPAYVGTEDVAQTWAGELVGTRENYYINGSCVSTPSVWVFS